MPGFYLVPYPTTQDPGQVNPRRSRTDEYTRLVYKPCRSGKLTLEGYRWALYLYGGENMVAVRTSATDRRFDSFLSQRDGERDAFRQALIDEGYTDLTDREVEYNIYVPHDVLTAYPYGQPATADEAKAYLERFPAPIWIRRNSPVYSGWNLHPRMWTGETMVYQIEDGALTPNAEQIPSSPTMYGRGQQAFGSGPPASPHTPSGSRNQPRADDQRPVENRRRSKDGKFVAMQLETMLSTKERGAILDAATITTWVADDIMGNNAQVVAEWRQLAKKTKPVIVGLHTRMQQQLIDECAPGPSATPASVRNKINHPSRAGDSPQTAITFNSGEEEEELVYQQAPVFDQPQPRGAKRARHAAEKTGSGAATQEDRARYFRALAKEIGGSTIVNNAIKLDPTTMAVRAHEDGRALSDDETILYGGHGVRLGFLCDKDGNGIFVPCGTTKMVIDFVREVQRMDNDSLTGMMPAMFVWRHYLRARMDFGVCRVVWASGSDDKPKENRQIDLAKTADAWGRQHGANISEDAVRNFQRRLLAMRSYLRTNGVVKAYAMIQEEVVALASDVTDDELIDAFGPLPNALDQDEEER